MCKKYIKKIIPDRLFLKILYKKLLGKKLDLRHPKTFNEKIQWLKLHDRKAEYIDIVDKYTVKKWVADKIGEEYIIPTLGVWERFEDIDFDSLPKQFVLKCTHDSGGLIIVKDKSKMDLAEVKNKINKFLNNNFYWVGREWPYKYIKRRIIAEPYLTDESGVELKDYKVFNFNGESKFIQVDFDRFVDHKRNLYTLDWEYIDAVIGFPTDPTYCIKKPKCLNKMLELAGILSYGIPHVRTDFYCIGDQVYFGEMTFYHGSGFEKITPESFEMKMGEWLTLPCDKTH